MLLNYLYNGVKLPPLPEWDKTAYPYAVIVQVDLLGTPSMWDLYLTSTPLAAYIGTGGVAPRDFLKATAEGQGKRYIIDLSQDHTDWTDESDIELTSGENVVSIGADFMMTKHALLWCNYDVFNYGQDTIYRAASYPTDAETGEEIHDYEIVEFTLTARDLYRKINGKPTKLTLYKKVGGKLIPLDEHTKGGNT